MEIRCFTQEYSAEWDRFCENALQGTFLHSRRFLSYHRDRFIDKSLIISQEGKWLGILPAALSPNNLFEVVSHPGISYGGILHQGGLRGAVMIEALNLVRDFYSNLGFESFLYKATPTIYHRSPAQDDIYALHRMGAKRYRCDLSCCIDLSMRTRVSERRKRSLKKAIQAGTEVDYGITYAIDLWQILTKNLREKHDATPTHTVDEITLLAKLFPENIKFVVARNQELVVAGVVLFYVGHTIHAQYIASSLHGQEISALDLILERCIIEASDQGARFFDFGISTEAEGSFLNEGLYRFKTEFGGGGIVHEFYKINLGNK